MHHINSGEILTFNPFFCLSLTQFEKNAFRFSSFVRCVRIIKISTVRALISKVQVAEETRVLVSKVVFNFYVCRRNSYLLYQQFSQVGFA